MNLPLPPWLARISLAVVAFGAALGWRLELEWGPGWSGTVWIHHFFWAVPIGVALFVLWAALVAPVANRKAFSAALVGFALLAYYSTLFLLLWLFPKPGLGGLVQVYKLSNLLHLPTNVALAFLLVVPVILWVLIPLGFSFVCQRFGLHVDWKTKLASTALFLLGWPLAIWLRPLFETKGGSDLAHALKSGFVIPFLVVALAWPLVVSRNPSESPQH